ncbi:MAG: hypothetical protein JW966_07715 [Anaerolineae bacterium]|nr:hypothetical protein [Anaerolineae bacterium]
MVVRIIKDWDVPDLLRQTPGQTGWWDDITFTIDPVDQCDYVVVLNRSPQPVRVTCPPQHIWQITQEPPFAENAWRYAEQDVYYRMVVVNPNLQGEKYVHDQPALPWHVNRTYDELKTAPVPEKTRTLSWVTSNKTWVPGQRDRMAFLDAIRGTVEFDLWGKGFTLIPDKWDGLAPYRYSLAIENYSGPYYWSEKLADCFLSWTMPIYYGCTHIEDYFPPESMVRININNPDEAIATIQDVVHGDRYERHRDAIAEARRLVLERYQLFPFLAGQIRAFEQNAVHTHTTAELNHIPAVLPPSPASPPTPHPVRRLLSRVKGKLKSLVSPH